MILPPNACPNCKDTGTVILGAAPAFYGYCFGCGLTGPRAESEETAAVLFNNLGGEVIYTEYVAEVSPDNEITFILRHLRTTDLVYYSYDMYPDGRGGLRPALFYDTEKAEKIRAWKMQNPTPENDPPNPESRD